MQTRLKKYHVQEKKYKITHTNIITCANFIINMSILMPMSICQCLYIAKRFRINWSYANANTTYTVYMLIEAKDSKCIGHVLMPSTYTAYMLI